MTTTSTTLHANAAAPIEEYHLPAGHFIGDDGDMPLTVAIVGLEYPTKPVAINASQLVRADLIESCLATRTIPCESADGERDVVVVARLLSGLEDMPSFNHHGGNPVLLNPETTYAVFFEFMLDVAGALFDRGLIVGASLFLGLENVPRNYHRKPVLLNPETIFTAYSQFMIDFPGAVAELFNE